MFKHTNMTVKEPDLEKRVDELTLLYFIQHSHTLEFYLWIKELLASCSSYQNY